MSLEILGVAKSSLASCAVVFVSSDGVVDDFMVSGPDVSNPLGRHTKLHRDTDRKVDLVAKLFSQC